MFSNLGDTAIIRGDVTTGSIVRGLDCGVHIYRADGKQTNTLTLKQSK